MSDPTSPQQFEPRRPATPAATHATACRLEAEMSHSWVSRANALATYAGTVLAVVCLAVTATGAAASDTD